MTMFSAAAMNPMVHLKHAWENTHSKFWGKLTIILFYVYIWAGVIAGVLAIIYPSYMMNGDCYFRKETEYGVYTMTTGMKQGNLFTVGFLLYADRGGIKFWNVSMVFVFSMINFWWMWVWNKNWPTMEGAPTKCDEDCSTTILVMMAWITLAWIFSFLEHRATSRGGGGGSSSPDESTPLNA